MSIIKNPISLAVIVAIITFVIASYILKEKSNKHKEKKSRNHKNKKSPIFDETVLITTTIAGLVTWLIASYYSTSTIKTDVVKGASNPVSSAILLPKGGNGKQSVPNISTEDSSRSYNLVGTGLNIPDPNVIPKVLIDIQ